MKRENIPLPKSLMAKQEDHEEWVEEEETSEDEGINAKYLMDLIKDSLDDNHIMCGVDTSQTVQGSSQNL